MTQQRDIRKFVPIRSAVKQAIGDMYGDFEKDQARFMAWGVRGFKKLTRQSLRSIASGKRYAVLNINKNINSATLPLDFEEETFVGVINEYGQRIALNINPDIVNISLIDETPCDQPCEAKCNCYPKQMCADLQTTQVINKILINDTSYDETVTTTILPNGDYYKITTTPYLDTVNSEVVYKDKKEYLTNFDLETCGCIKKTKENDLKVAAACWEAYCCYCGSCSVGNTDFGGYKIFKEAGCIVFDPGMRFDKCYIEYRGGLPKSGNEYLIPEVSFETLINYMKFKSVENKKGVSMSDREWHLRQYIRELENMNKVNGRMKLEDILHSALLVPKFDYNSDGCYTPSNLSYQPKATQTVVTKTVYVDSPSPVANPSRPSVITVEGSQMEDGITYSNNILAGVPLLIFADPINRHLTSSEYTILPGGGFSINIGVYGAGDFFHITPKWWLV